MIVGERLRGLRKKKGYSRKQLADHLNIGEANVQRYENEDSDPSSEVVSRIARFFNVSTDYLLGLSEVPSGHVGDILDDQETEVIYALRSGDKLKAIQAIMGNKQ